MIIQWCYIWLTNLVGVSETAHARHDAEDVVGDGVHEELSIRATDSGGGLDTVEGEGHIVQTREVGGTGGLMRLGVEGERVQVHVLGGDASVVLVGLDQTEVGRVTLGETVVAVELKLAGGESIGGLGIDVRERELGITEVQCLVATATDNPHKLLHGVVEVKAEVGGLGDLGAGVLELLNEVLMRRLGETATLIGVEVDVVDEELGRVHFKRHETDRCGVDRGRSESGLGAELDVDLDLVVLEGNEGEGETGVAVEEELEGNVELAGLHGAGGVTATDHLLKAGTLLLGEGELGPDLEPLTIVLVDTLTADLELNVLNEGVA